MHLTFARWNITDWLTRGSFFPYELSDPQFWPALLKDLETWMIATSPELLNLNRMMQIRRIIGKPTHSGRWRIIMIMEISALLRRFRLLKNQLETVLQVGFFNLAGELHFSLDTWEGVIPPYIRARTLTTASDNTPVPCPRLERRRLVLASRT